MSMFLTPEELSQLTGYRENQRTRIRRWLTRNGIAHRTNRLGDPVVLRADLNSEGESVEPNFATLKR